MKNKKLVNGDINSLGVGVKYSGKNYVLYEKRVSKNGNEYDKKLAYYTDLGQLMGGLFEKAVCNTDLINNIKELNRVKEEIIQFGKSLEIDK